MNKASRFLVLAVVGGLIAWLSVLQGRLARSELEQLQLQAAQQNLAAQHKQTRDEIESLRRELSAQRSDASERASLRAQAAKTGGELRPEPRTLPDPSGGRLASDNGPPHLRQLPARVDAAIVERFGPMEIREAQPSIHKGKSVYLVQGLTGDGRSVGVIVTPDGTILTSKSEMSASALPENITAAIREVGGHTTIEKSLEIYSPDGALEYALMGQSEDGRMVSLNISADGRITSGEVERSANDLPESVRNTMTQTVRDVSPSSVRQVFGGKGAFYEIGFNGESERVHLVIDDLGRLVSFASKANLGLDQPGEKPKP